MLNSTQSSMPPSHISPLVCLFLQPAIQESISAFMARVHASVNKASEKYQRNEKGYDHTTPKSFLEQIKLYNNLLERSHEQLQRKMHRLWGGLEELQSTFAQGNYTFGCIVCSDRVKGMPSGDQCVSGCRGSTRSPGRSVWGTELEGGAGPHEQG